MLCYLFTEYMHRIVKTNFLSMLLIALLFTVTGCKEGQEQATDTLAISMSASVKQTKTLISSIGDLQLNHRIGIYGFKEQNTNTSNKHLVFNNQQLKYESNTGWDYSPKRYWDMQTRYSFIAYAPYSAEGVSNNSFSSITIANIPQYQNAVAAESKDYIVALSKNTAKAYVESYNKTVNLTFHHILSNFQIWAYYDGFDTEFKITALHIGVDENGKKVPSADTKRTYTQQFDKESADGDFNNPDLNNYGVALPFTGFTVPKDNAAQAANLLIVPFVADANGTQKIPLTIYYTKNGVEQNPATISIGISEFKSDSKYRLDLKFESKGATVVPVNIQIKNWTETDLEQSDIHNW